MSTTEVETKSIGALTSIFHDSEKQMQKASDKHTAAVFFDHFRLRSGDLIEFQRECRVYSYWTYAKILYVEDCFYNRASGYTAYLKILPLLATGKMGNSRGLWISTSDGQKIKQVRGVRNGVRRVSTSTSLF